MRELDGGGLAGGDVTARRAIGEEPKSDGCNHGVARPLEAPQGREAVQKGPTRNVYMPAPV